MTKRHRSFALLAIVIAAGVATANGCGSDTDTPLFTGDGGADGSSLLDGSGLADGSNNNIDDGGGVPVGDGSNGLCAAQGATCTSSTQCCSANCNAGKCGDPIGDVKPPGSGCTSPTQCSTGVCIDGKCGNSVCISDKQVCFSNASCCSGKCSGVNGAAGTCTPLTTACLTSGNQCTAGGMACCSGSCNNGLCAGSVSFCTQVNDACSTDAQCCTGTCKKAAGATLGTCGSLSVPGATQCTIAGQLCGTSDAGVTTGGIPECGGQCCSRACGPSFVKGIQVCANPSGCHPTGEICHTDDDCCGSDEYKVGDQVLSNGSGHCSKANVNDPVGRCDNGMACRPLGAICKVPTVQCTANAENNCCSGNILENKPETWVNCQQDILGIPRCTGAGNCAGKTAAEFAGKPCGSSADCCNLTACTPNAASPTGFTCAAAACVPVDSACSNNGDCCPGNYCTIPAGATFGSCKPIPPPPPPPDGGTGVDSGTGGTCSLYGQTCTDAPGSCCDGIPCISGRCRVP
jgi:hypothetical protein